jgi:transcriptional regulator with XRE-family HTH domain
MKDQNQTLQAIANDVLVKLRKMRQEKDNCQQHIAHQLNLSQSYYSRLERGKEDLTISKLDQIVSFLNLDISEIMEDLTNSSNRFGKDDYVQFLKSSINFLKEELWFLREQNLELIQVLKKNKLLE